MVTVAFFVTVNLSDLDVKIDMKRIKKNDTEYIMEIQDHIKDFAGHIFETSSVKPVIHSSDIEELVE